MHRERVETLYIQFTWVHSVYNVHLFCWRAVIGLDAQRYSSPYSYCIRNYWMVKSFPIYFSFTAIFPSARAIYSGHISCQSFHLVSFDATLINLSTVQQSKPNDIKIHVKLCNHRQTPRFNSEKQKQGNTTEIRLHSAQYRLWKTTKFTQLDCRPCGDYFCDAHISIQAFYVFINRRIDKHKCTQWLCKVPRRAARIGGGITCEMPK